MAVEFEVVVEIPRGSRNKTDLSDVPHHLCEEISHFFVVYKDLEPGKHTHVIGWSDRAAADAAVARAKEHGRTARST